MLYGGAAHTNVIIIALVLSDPESAIYRMLGEYANNYTTDDINCTLVFKDSHSKLTVTHRNLKVTNSNLNVTHINLNVTHSNHNICFLFTLMQKKQQQNKQKNKDKFISIF
jgi:hypothetical protein